MCLQSNPKLQALIDEYLALDQDPTTRSELQSLIDRNDQDQLWKLLSGRMSFGTAGLRAPIGVGYTRMNCLTVIQTTQGLYKYLEREMPDFLTRGIVVGTDHRHRSNDFGKLIAGVFLAKGVPVYYYRSIVHTPLVPFAVTELRASCGIMVTASHNPKEDNGYKLYWDNGCQIISPHDKHIAQLIEYVKGARFDT